LLEPVARKRAWPVLRGPRRSNAPGLPDEIWFSILTRKVLRRGEFPSRQTLADKILKFVGEYNAKARPFRWSYDGRPLKAA
jgi:hypothetical protein